MTSLPRRHATQPSGTASAVVTAVSSDIDTLSQVIADAFLDLPPSRWLVPDDNARREIFPGYFRLYVEHAMNTGLVHTTPGRDAVALWLPSSASPPDGHHERLAAVTGPWISRFQTFDAVLDQHHPAGFAHHHLAILAVRPERQRHGVGSTLLNAHHAVLDDDRVPAYLEASDPGTRALYLRHGYADFGSPIQLPDGPEMYPMVRPPKSHAQ